MRQCSQCGSYSPDYSQYCRTCGSSLTTELTATSASTTQAPAPPPTVVRRRKYRAFIPGLGIFGFLHRDPQTGQLGCGPGCLISAALVAVVVLGGFLYLSHQSPSGSATLSIGGSVVPGEPLQVHGSNFPPNSTVRIMVDGAPAFTSYPLHKVKVVRGARVYASIWNIVAQARLELPSDNTVTVRNDGTFDATIPIPSSWVPGSHHTIQAITQDVQASTQASIDVVPQVSNPTATVPPTTAPTTPPTTGVTTTSPTTSPCNLSASTTSLDFGTIQQAQSSTAAKSLTLSNSGGQPVSWNGDLGGATWLTLNPTSDTIQAGGQEMISVSVDASQLQPTTYSTTLTFSSSCGSPQVAVSLVVTPPSQPPVMQLSANSLNFTLGCNNPQSQSITITNGGGGTLTWSAGTPSQSWLTVISTTPTSGSTPGTLTLQADPTGLANTGNTPDTATVNITGSDGTTQTVTVTLTVQCVP